MTLYENYVRYLETLCPNVPIEDRARFFACFTKKPIDKTDLEWYNEHINKGKEMIKK